MDEYSDAVYHELRSDVLHKVRIYWLPEKIASACEEAIVIDFNSNDVFEEGEFTDGFLRWLRKGGRRVYALCCHCQNRDFEDEIL